MSNTDSVRWMTAAQILRSDCRYINGRRLRLGQAVLSPGAVRFSGWMGWNRYSDTLNLLDVEAVRRESDLSNANLVVVKNDGSVYTFRVNGAGIWKQEIERRVRGLKQLQNHSGEPRSPRFDADIPAVALQKVGDDVLRAEEIAEPGPARVVESWLPVEPPYSVSEAPRIRKSTFDSPYATVLTSEPAKAAPDPTNEPHSRLPIWRLLAEWTG